MAQTTDVFQLVISGSVYVLFITLFVIYYVLHNNKKFLLQQAELQRIRDEKNQEILKAIVQAQEEERSRIATSLHDSIGADLSMLKLNLSRYAFFMSKNTPELQPLQDDINHLDLTIQNFRSICRDLYPVTLQSFGFVKTFEDLIHRLREQTDIVCKYKINIKESDLFVDLASKLNLLRIIQEVIHNLIKYGACSYLDIGFLKLENNLLIAFKHDGSSFTNDDAQHAINEGKGMGLVSINNRLHLMEGKIDYFRSSNGSEIIISIPLINGQAN